METENELVGVLNDLIRINNDRVEGYQRASNETKDTDVDLKGIFNEMADQSEKFVRELIQQVTKLGGDPASDTTISGKVYRVWMDLKAAVSGKSRTNILESCEYGEDVAQKAYDSALQSDAAMTTEIRQLIAEQKSSLKNSHDIVKKYRDMQQKVS